MSKISRFTAVVTLIAFSTSELFAANFYLVETGDTLTKVVKINFPKAPIYGINGKLKEIISLNPQIKNIHRIYPKQKIQLVPEVNEAHAETEIPAIAKEENITTKERVISSTLGIDEWNLSVLYGAKYLSLDQSGSLGKASVGALFLNDIKLNSEFIFEDWSFGFQMDTYKFKYESLSSGDSKQMSALSLYGTYKWILAGFNLEETPLFRNNGGNIEMTKNTLMYFSLGAKKDIELPTRKPTALKLKSWISYPLSSSSDRAEVKLDSVSGFTLGGQAELNRQIFAKEDYSLCATFMTNVGYSNIKQDVEWDVSKGTVKSQIFNLSSGLGLLLKF